MLTPLAASRTKGRSRQPFFRRLLQRRRGGSAAGVDGLRAADLHCGEHKNVLSACVKKRNRRLLALGDSWDSTWCASARSRRCATSASQVHKQENVGGAAKGRPAAQGGAASTTGNIFGTSEWGGPHSPRPAQPTNVSSNHKETKRRHGQPKEQQVLPLPWGRGDGGAGRLRHRVPGAAHADDPVRRPHQRPRGRAGLPLPCRSCVAQEL